MVKFIHWLKKNVGMKKITELSAADKLYEFRSVQENFQGNSFDPIIAYGAHGAIVHYSATEETNIPLEPKGLVLMDTGGHDRKSTRLNSSHRCKSYAVFCLKKKRTGELIT